MNAKKTVKILPETYKPTKKELEEDVRIDATPQQLVKAVVQTVNLEKMSVSEHRKARK